MANAQRICADGEGREEYGRVREGGVGWLGLQVAMKNGCCDCVLRVFSIFSPFGSPIVWPVSRSPHSTLHHFWTPDFGASVFDNRYINVPVSTDVLASKQILGDFRSELPAVFRPKESLIMFGC